MSGVGDWAAFEAVDEEVTSAVVSDIYAEFISIVFSDDAELIENTLASSFSACLSGQILHRITENDSSVSGFSSTISAAFIKTSGSGFDFVMFVPSLTASKYPSNPVRGFHRS